MSWAATITFVALLIGGALFWRHYWRTPQQQDDDIKYTHHPGGWRYQFEDPINGPVHRLVTASGFKTKYHARRAARIERDRIAEGRHRGTDQ